MKTAIVCDWLTSFAGSEKVLGEMIRVFPDADVFAVVDFLPDDARDFLRGKEVRTTFIQGLPFARKRFRSYLPLMPLAVEQIDLSGYDLVLSSSHAVAKGVLTGPEQLHISYVHTPMRYAWDMQAAYLAESGFSSVKKMLARGILHYLRIWDARTAAGVDRFITNSQYIARRIMKCYRREAKVIYPPVDVDVFTPSGEKGDYYLTASRLVSYKKVRLIAEAFRGMPDKKLVIIGDGPEGEAVRRLSGGNIEFLGYQPFEVLRDKLRHARAFVFAAEEDFGIAPVEAMACGTPVIAYGHGGALETVRDIGEFRADGTGIFFEQQTAESIKEAVARFEETEASITPEACRRNAERFSRERFREELRTYIEECIRNFP